MDDPTFWDLIDRLDWRDPPQDDDLVVEPVVQALAALPDSQIAGFQETLAAKLHALDGRAWARHSGDDIWWGEPDSLSVDGFLYARCAVVASGRELYERVLANPARMPRDVEFESLLYVAASGYERKTGLEDDGLLDTELSFETFANRDGWAPDPG